MATAHPHLITKPTQSWENIPHIQPGFKVYTARVNDNDLRNAKDTFRTKYANPNSHIRTQPISTALTYDVLSKLLIHPNTHSEGMVIHYGRSPQSGDLEYFLSAGKIENETVYHSPFTDQSDRAYYILCNDYSSRGSYFRIYHQDVFHKSTQNYYDTMRMQKDDGTVCSINQISDHPKRVYHQGAEIFAFYTQNEKLFPTHLYLEHGVARSAGTQTSEAYHVPYLLLGDKTGPFPILLSSGNSAQPYLNMGADMGHLSPPN